ncbi:terminase large subunit [Schlesneria paludicola]|uniref:terminase large subunit n=2 Tax=Schlesneria paludicola TaxID=360056 RepID=UPI00030F2E1D|nr:terminase TerL endonuclease subunit [Schlesneria paludicola]
MRKCRVSANRRDLERYCDDVLAKKVVVGTLERAAVERYRHDCDTAGARGIYWDDEDFERTISFVQLLKHSTGEFCGHPFILKPWQKFVAGNLFAWKNKDTGFRRFRECFISMGRGNGKSPFMAALVNRLYLLDNEPRSQFQLAAVERAQAEIVFNEICEQLQSQPAFGDRFEYYRPKHGKKSIVDKILGGVIEPLGSEGRDGYNLLGYVADEIHAWAAEHNALWEKLESSMRKRRQPLGMVISTAGDDRSKLWLRVHKFSSQIARLLIKEDRHFSFICEIDEEDRKASLYDETLWRKGNPNLDVSVKREALRLIANKAKNDPVCFNEWLRYHMNIRVRSVLKVIDHKLWTTCKETMPDLTGRHCHGGLDLGWRNDLASLYLCFPLDKKRFAFKGWNWLPRHGGRDLTASPWSQWIENRDVVACDGDATDPDAIYERLQQVRRDHAISSVALDPANARAVGLHLVNNMGMSVFDFGQNCQSYNEPIREFLTALGEGRILHDNDPVLAWAADNLVLRTNPAGLVMPDKEKADEKIDPIVAAFMAFARCLYGDPVSSGPRIRSL